MYSQYTYPIDSYNYQHDLDELTAKVGMRVLGDEWDWSLPIIAGDEIDRQYFDTDLRYARNDDIIPSLPVKIRITGRVIHVAHGQERVRVEITTWDANEEPVSFPGWLFLN